MVLSLTRSIGDHNPDFYDRSFRRVVEDHLSYLIPTSENKVITLRGDEALRWQGDLFSLLKTKGIQRDMWWAVMRVNGMQSPRDFRQDMLTLYIVDEVKFSKLRTVWRTYKNTAK